LRKGSEELAATSNSRAWGRTKKTYISAGGSSLSNNLRNEKKGEEAPSGKGVSWGHEGIRDGSGGAIVIFSAASEHTNDPKAQSRGEWAKFLKKNRSQRV